ncbi:uncharacterized protein cubi_00143 [Cryptosporidium ubiquitum]|uniref:Uncharacterized protein n=1 Tax=Cryptosporidium ubiquitum TaxID=857276 RepID=A0A1J4MK56_9CRYT|nr:uncharacterized protein cubi_00143 [Cryptosporidium ubiquitum]OII74590.1 hypothetical protein cubi_00143 [Cryptosporidium ubiquitum]
MFTYSIVGFNLRTEETPLTKKLEYALAFILVLQFIIVILRVVTLTDVISTFFEIWMIYLGYVVYTEKPPCLLFLFISISFVRGILLLLTTIERLKRNAIVSNVTMFSKVIKFSDPEFVEKLRIIIFIASPILSFLACIISYYIFKNIHVVEEIDELLNQFINPWNGSNAEASAGENAANATNEAGIPSTNTNINSTSAPSHVIYTPFTGKSYKLSDISSSSSTTGKTGNYPIYKGA